MDQAFFGVCRGLTQAAELVLQGWVQFGGGEQIGLEPKGEKFGIALKSLGDVGLSSREGMHLPQRLADLLEMGLRLGLQSSRSEHRLSVDAATGLERLRVTMPLSGGYEQLRQYIEAALRHDPGLSLDGLKLRRTSPQAAELEASVQAAEQRWLNRPR